MVNRVPSFSVNVGSCARGFEGAVGTDIMTTNQITSGDEAN